MQSKGPYGTGSTLKIINFGTVTVVRRIHIPNTDPDSGQPKNADPNPHHSKQKFENEKNQKMLAETNATAL